jgi:hypothetical protein
MQILSILSFIALYNVQHYIILPFNQSINKIS